MDIVFKSSKEKTVCEKHQTAVQRFGMDPALSLRRRLDELRAADNLGVFAALPYIDLRELRGRIAGRLLVQVTPSLSIMLEAAKNPSPPQNRNGVDPTSITAVRILSVREHSGPSRRTTTRRILSLLRARVWLTRWMP